MPLVVLGCGAGRRLDLGGDHRGDDPADPAVHGAGGGHDARAHGAAAAHAGAAGGSLPRCGGGAADAEGLRAGEGPGRGDRADHRSLPPQRARGAARRLPVVADPRAGGDDLGGACRGRDRPASDERESRLAQRAVRAGARAGGLSAAAPAGRQLPRERRGHGGGGAGVRGARAAGGTARYAHGRARPGADWSCASRVCASPIPIAASRRSTTCR